MSDIKPSKSLERRLRKYGTEEQIEKFKARVAKWDEENPDDTYAGGKQSQGRQPNYGPEPTKLEKVSLHEAPVDKVKSALWKYYQFVLERDGVTKIKVTEEIKGALSNALNWLLCDLGGDWNPAKSLMIYGQCGSSKSSLAEAMSLTSKYIDRYVRNYDRRLEFVSLDRLFLKTYTTQSLEGIGELAEGGLVLDEVKESHVEYNHYGSKMPIINDVLSARHELWKRDGVQTIFTTNMTPKKFVEIVDSQRLAERMKQQYQDILITKNNFRNE